jgi:2-(1,2-epoxy-1,2-dihydrophenyl)acetyl-CoA isomerase
MTTPQSILIKNEAGIATIELNRPQKKNSLSIAGMLEIQAAIESLQKNTEVRVIRIKGSGGSFCAGRDLSDVNPQTDETLTILREQINPVLATIRACPIPTFAQVEGPALGFGFGLALACDIVYAAENAIMGSPFRNIGLVLDSGGHFYMKERLGRAKAMELILTSKMLSGLESEKIGLINRSVAASDLEEVSMKLLKSIATGPTAAFIETKYILDHATTYDDVVDMEAVAQAKLMLSADAKEGLEAFQQKRKPKFKGC